MCCIFQPFSSNPAGGRQLRGCRSVVFRGNLSELNFHKIVRNYLLSYFEISQFLTDRDGGRWEKVAKKFSRFSGFHGLGGTRSQIAVPRGIKKVSKRGCRGDGLQMYEASHQKRDTLHRTTISWGSRPTALHFFAELAAERDATPPACDLSGTYCAG